MVNHLRDPRTPGYQVEEGEETLDEAFRRPARLLARAWSLCSNYPDVQALRPDVAYFEEVRVWMAKLDAWRIARPAASRCPRTSRGC